MGVILSQIVSFLKNAIFEITPLCVITRKYGIHIPNKKFAVRNFHHSFSSKATLLHYNLKKLNSIIKQTKHSLNSGTPIPLYHNSTITYLNSTHQLQLLPIPSQSNLIPNWITNAKEAWKSLYHARNLENIKYTR